MKMPDWFPSALAAAQHQDQVNAWPKWQQLAHRLLVRRCPACRYWRGNHPDKLAKLHRAARLKIWRLVKWWAEAPRWQFFCVTFPMSLWSGWNAVIAPAGLALYLLGLLLLTKAALQYNRQRVTQV